MAQPLVVPGRSAGELMIPSLGRTLRLVEWREDDFYDTVQLAGVTPAAGSAMEFFRDLSSKNIQHTNLKTPRRIPSGSEFILTRIGVLVHQGYANTLIDEQDMVKLAYNANLTFKLNDRLISEGLLVKYQSGFGVTGAVATTATTTTRSLATIGVPSAAAAPNLLVAQSVKDDDDLQAALEFRDNTWLNGTAMPTFTARPVVTLMLHGLIKKPQGK